MILEHKALHGSLVLNTEHNLHLHRERLFSALLWNFMTYHHKISYYTQSAPNLVKQPVHCCVGGVYVVK
jgi:hypothetical protein